MKYLVIFRIFGEHFNIFTKHFNIFTTYFGNSMILFEIFRNSWAQPSFFLVFGKCFRIFTKHLVNIRKHLPKTRKKDGGAHEFLKISKSFIELPKYVVKMLKILVKI